MTRTVCQNLHPLPSHQCKILLWSNVFNFKFSQVKKKNGLSGNCIWSFRATQLRTKHKPGYEEVNAIAVQKHAWRKMQDDTKCIYHQTISLKCLDPKSPKQNDKMKNISQKPLVDEDVNWKKWRTTSIAEKQKQLIQQTPQIRRWHRSRHRSTDEIKRKKADPL